MGDWWCGLETKLLVKGASGGEFRQHIKADLPIAHLTGVGKDGFD